MRTSVARGRANVPDRLTGTRQQVAATVDDGDILWAQARHRGGDQGQDRLHALVVESRRARHGQHHRCLCFLLVAGERFAPRQHQMHARGAYAADHAYGARQFAFHGTGLVDRLLELVGGEAVVAVEDLVADGAARGQSIAGQQQPGMRDFLVGHHDLAAGRVEPVGDVLAFQLGGDLSGLPRVQVGIEQRHVRIARREGDRGQCRQRDQGDYSQRGQPAPAQRFQPVDQRLHDRTRHGVWTRLADTAGVGTVLPRCASPRCVMSMRSRPHVPGFLPVPIGATSPLTAGLMGAPPAPARAA